MDPVGVFLKCECYTNDGTVIAAFETNLVNDLTTEWQTYAVDFTTPAGTVSNKFLVLVWNDTNGSYEGAAYFDNAVMARCGDPPLKVDIGGTQYEPTGDFTNAMVTVTDGDLAGVSAANPFRLRLAAYDRLSGLSRGTTDSSTQMNVDIGSWKTDDVADYYEAESSPYTNTFGVGATSTWRWTGFTTADIDALMGTNKVTVSLFDADNDRSDDRGIVTNQQFGYLAVVDDDSTAPWGGNMLFNPGFEIGDAGVSPTCAWHWAWGNPDHHGSYWGDVNVEKWRSHSGTNEATIRDWSGANPSGGWWQEVPCSGAGIVWYAEAWFWNDSGYTNTASKLRLEFYDANTQAVGGATNSFTLPGESWSKVTLLATSVTGTAWARVTVVAEGQGQTGALQFDDVVLQPVRPLQIRIGGSFLQPSDYTTNAKFYVDVNILTNVSDSNPFYLIFNAHDPESGLSRGTTDPNTQMNVDFQNVSTDNVANFVLTNSSPDADTDLTTATNVWVWYSFSSTQIDALTNSVTNLIAATLFNADNDRTGDRESAVNLQFGFLVVTGTLPKVHQIVIDGETNDWLGTPPAVDECSTISSNEFIWRDRKWEQRTVPGTNDVNNDLWELRIYADSNDVYFLVRMQNIFDFAHPYLAIGVDVDQDPADTNMNWIADDADTTLGDGYFTNGNAAMHYPERQIIVHNIDGTGQRIELYADDGSSWYAPPTGAETATVWSLDNDVMEFKIPRADLLLTGDVTARFTVATFQNAQIYANDGDSTTNYDGSDALDTISIYPYGINAGGLDLNAWDQEISDGDIDFYFDVYFSSTGMAPNVVPQAPSLLWPTNGAVIEKGAGPFEWTAATDTESEVTSYLFELSTNANFNGSENGAIFYRLNVRHTNDPNWISTNIHLSVTNLLGSSATQWYWRVRARDAAGALSGISGTNMFQFTDTDDDTQGPVATLLYVGTNYQPGLSPIKTNIYDGELADTNNPVDIAVMWQDPSGVFLTNHPPHASDNIYSEWGRVIPNWDVADVVPGVSTTYYGWDEVFTNFMGYNGATAVTTYNHDAFSITNLDLTHEYYLTVSAEDEDNDKGTQPDPDANGDPVPIDRYVTTNQHLSFRILDDDTTYPTIFGTTNLLQNPGFEQGTSYWTWTDYVYFQGYAAYAGTNGVEFVTGDPLNAWGNIWQGITNASASNIYKMAFYARKQSNEFYAGRVYMKLEFYDSAGTMIVSNQIDILDDLTTNWQLFTHAAAAPTGTVEVRVSFGYDWGSNPVTRLFVDSVDLTEAPPPLGIKIGSTNYPGSYELGAVASTNAIYTLTDGDLAEVDAANPLEISFRVFDSDDEGDSGLSRGTTDVTTQMNISVDNLTTNNVADYESSKSSADTRNVGSTSVWSFTSVSSNSIGAMYDAGSNAVRATVRDADFDRVDDQLSVTNMLFGYLQVIDDDTNTPELTGFGMGSSTNITDAELAAGFNLTGLVRDVGSGINSNSVATGSDFGVNYDVWSTNGEVLADQLFDVAPADGAGLDWTGVSDSVTIP
ncbi:MAG TPA: hypothetical protein EYP62_02085, partial [Kiritimatiellae bacterium]|nr:hypothetical protein [Kiritimatiellia bacterium]